MRPPIAALSASPAQRPDAARQAATRAFFQAALGQPAPAAPAAAPEPAATPVRAQRLPEAGAEPPTRILRPGSLLDIRV
ncbi:MAG: hypothetical protein ABW360_04220 [Phenylobacterium sp.]